MELNLIIQYSNGVFYVSQPGWFLSIENKLIHFVVCWFIHNFVSCLNGMHTLKNNLYDE